MSRSEGKKLSDWDRGWLSGIIDSDGAICFNCANGTKRRFLTTRLQVDNTSKKLIQRVHRVIGSGAYWPYRTNENRKEQLRLMGTSFKKMWRYTCCSNTIRWLLPQLRLIAKKQRQEIILEALPLLKRGRWKTKKEQKRLENLILKMRKTHTKGTPMRSKGELK